MGDPKKMKPAQLLSALAERGVQPEDEGDKAELVALMTEVKLRADTYVPEPPPPYVKYQPPAWCRTEGSRRAVLPRTVARQVKLRAEYEATLLKGFTLPDLKAYLLANHSCRNGTKAELVELCIDGMPAWSKCVLGSAPQLGPCASSERALRLWAARHS